jgi:chromosome segregation ATPase
MPDQTAFQIDAFQPDPLAFQEEVVVPVVQQPSGGGRRIPNTYESLEPRLERARKIRRRLAEERKRLAELKKQQTKVERQFKELEQSALGLDAGPRTATVPEKPAVRAARVDRANLLEAQIKEYADRVALQAAKVRALRKEMDQAEREASDRNAVEAAMEAYRAQQAQSEWERIENERLQQEADDEELQMLLTLVHEDAL